MSYEKVKSIAIFLQSFALSERKRPAKGLPPLARARSKSERILKMTAFTSRHECRLANLP